jgi:hypothetical protein
MDIAKDETDDGKPHAAEGAAQTPAYYTPEEFAEAFADGTIDEAKLAPDVAAFYKAAMSRSQVPAQPVQQPFAAPGPVSLTPMPPQVNRAPVMSREQYAQLTEAAKNVACANYLGIKPEEFNEFDAEHAQARNFAMQEIRARASEIASQRAAEASRAQQLASEVSALDAEYRQKDPEFFAKHETVMQDYLGRMPFRAAAEAIRAIQAGDAAGIRKFIGAVYQDYKKGGKPAATPAKPAPPSLLSVGASANDKRGGFADASELSGMSAEDQADWLVKHGLV